MTTLETVAFVVAMALVVAFGVSGVVVSLRSGRPGRQAQHPLYAESVLVQLQDGSAIGGVLTGRIGEFLVLHNANLHEAGTQVAIDGAAWIPRSRIAWIQQQQANYVDGGER